MKETNKINSSTNQITKQNRKGIKQGDKNKELEKETILKEKWRNSYQMFV